MITENDAIATARSLLGTPYSQLDCINLIKRVIRTAPGGVPGYTTAGTNTLWRSATASAKYRDLTYTQEGIAGARAGMLAFKRKGTDVHHVGLVTGEGTVIHSSSAKGCVVETALDDSWRLLAVHRYIEAEGTRSAGPEGSGGISISPLDPSGLPYPLETTGAAAPGPQGEDTMTEICKAVVTTKRDPLTLRDAPNGAKIGTIPRGATVDVLDDALDDWWRVRCGGRVGYASAGYLERVPIGEDTTPEWATADQSAAQAVEATTLVREDGDGQVTLIGRWRVAEE